MAAALRSVAARLGGRAALRAANVPGRLPARILHTRPVNLKERTDAEMRFDKIEALKEELFDEITEFNRKYYISRLHYYNHEFILYPLSMEVKLRPGDTFRRSCRRMEILNRFLWFVGLVVTINFAGDGLVWCLKEAAHPERKEHLEEKKRAVMDWWNKQNQ